MWAGAFQVGASATAVLCATFFMHRQIEESAAARSALLRCALLAVLAVPILTAILPRWEVPGWREATREFDETRVSTHGRPPEYRVSAEAATAPPSRLLHVRIEWTWVLIFCWSGGAALVFARFMLSALAVRRTVTMSHAVDSGQVTGLAEAAMSFFSLRRRPCIRETAALSAGPAVAGILQPAILLPSGWRCWSDTTIRAVVLHETAHIRRRDPLFLLVGAVARSLYWPHPGIWWLTRATVREAEFACDEMVLSTGADPLEYADGLLRVARDSRALDHHWLSAAAPMAGRTSLEARVNSILDNPRAHEMPGRKWAVSGVPLLLAAVCSAAGPDTTIAAVPISATTHAAEAAKPATDVPPTQLSTPLMNDASDANAVAATPRKQPTEYATHAASSGRDESAVFQPDEPPSSDPPARRVVEGAGTAIVPLLLLADSAVQVRWQAASTIGLVEPAGGIDVLLRLLADRHPRVRETAAWALGEYDRAQLEEAGAIDRLVDAASDPDAGVRRQVAAVFGLHEPESVIAALLTLLDDTSARVRATTVWAAGEQRRRDLTEHLLAYADDVDARVRVQVARALARLPDRAWRPTLLQLGEDIDPEVRAFAALALEQLEK